MRNRGSCNYDFFLLITPVHHTELMMRYAKHRNDDQHLQMDASGGGVTSVLKWVWLMPGVGTEYQAAHLASFFRGLLEDRP